MKKLILLSIMLSFLTSCGNSIIDTSILNNIEENTCWCDRNYLICMNTIEWYKKGKCEKDWIKCAE